LLPFPLWFGYGDDKNALTYGLQFVIDIFKEFLEPASIVSILMLLGIGVVLLYVRGGKWGRRWLTAMAIFYWCLAMPVTEQWIERPLTRRFGSISTPKDAQGVRVIVVLSGGSITLRTRAGALTTATEESFLRSMEAARVYALLKPATVIASGGKPMPDVQAEPEAAALRDGLLKMHVPVVDIVMETESNTTYDEAIIVKRMLAARGTDRLILVTSPAHMARSMATFEAQGLHPIASVSAAGISFFPWSLVPSRRTLARSSMAIHEYAAFPYYWARGRMKRSSS